MCHTIYKSLRLPVRPTDKAVKPRTDRRVEGVDAAGHSHLPHIWGQRCESLLHLLPLFLFLSQALFLLLHYAYCFIINSLLHCQQPMMKSSHVPMYDNCCVQ